MKYLITQSLLSAWSYMHECVETKSDEARESFLAALRREQQEPSEEMLRGISFEDAVQAYLKGDKSAPYRHASIYAARGKEALEAAAVVKVAEIMRGGVYQLTAYKDVRIGGINFVLMAKCDWVRAGVIYDCKRVTNYEPGKYYHSAQHPMYLEVIDSAFKFQYVVCDGEEVYTMDAYKREDMPQDIVSIISEFIADMRAMDLLETYFEYWKSKY